MAASDTYDIQARHFDQRAQWLRELATEIRASASPLDSCCVSLQARHTPGIWLSEGAKRSRDRLHAVQVRVDDAAHLCAQTATRLERLAADATRDAATSRRRAEVARRNERASSRPVADR